MGKFLLVLLFASVCKASPSGVLYLSGYVPEKGFTLSGDTITASPGYVLVINGVQTNKAKLTNSEPYTIMVMSDK